MNQLTCAKDLLDFEADLNPKSTMKKKNPKFDPDPDPAANLDYEHHFKIY